MAHRILILGGTTEARQLAGLLAGDPRYDATLSLAGRTAEPKALPLPVRSGGFGGIDGLADYLTRENIDLLIDATHPFATRISANAAEASARTGTPVFALRRPGWSKQSGDNWTSVPDLEAAVEPAQADSALANERIVTAESRAAAAQSLAAGLRETLAMINPAPAKKR
mgnify:CR=1 FL=1